VKDGATYLLAAVFVFATRPTQAQEASPQILKIAAGSEASRQVALAPVTLKRAHRGSARPPRLSLTPEPLPTSQVEYPRASSN
jgi:hypothetical protein